MTTAELQQLKTDISTKFECDMTIEELMFFVYIVEQVIKCKRNENRAG